ncbi:MAG: hypothetical protein ACRBBN_00095 [Methyloligellaceae bacterium]
MNKALATLLKIIPTVVLLSLLCVLILSMLFRQPTLNIPLTKSISHPDGLTARTPEQCQSQITETPHQALQICINQRATPIHLSILDKLDIQGLSIKKLPNGNTAYYKTTHKESPGSGGDEYSIIIARQEGGKWLYLRRSVYREFGSPDFLLEWAIFNSAALTGQKKRK